MTVSPGRRLARWWPRLLGPAILAFFLARTDLGQILAFLQAARWTPVLLSLALFPIFVLLKAWRWGLLVRTLSGHSPPLGTLMVLYMIGLFLGGATPGQAGDFLKAWYLRDRGHKLGSALFSIVLDRLFDFLVMGWVTLLGLSAVLGHFPQQLQSPIRLVAVGAAVAFTVGLSVLVARGSRDRIVGLGGRVLPRRWATALQRGHQEWSELHLRPALVAKLLVASLGSLASTVVRLWLLFQAVDVTVPAAALLAAIGLIAILQAAPISFAGVGVRDAVLIAVLGAFGYDAERALALSALFLLLNIEHMVIGFAAFLVHRAPRGGPGLVTGHPDSVPDGLSPENGR